MNLQKSSKIIQKKNIQDHPKSLGFSFRNKKTTSKKSSKLNPQPSPFPLSDPTDTAVSSQAVTELKKTSQSFELGILKIPTDRVIVLMEEVIIWTLFFLGWVIQIQTWCKCVCKLKKILVDTADGSEIQRLPVEVGILSHYLQGFIHSRWLAGFLNHLRFASKTRRWWDKEFTNLKWVSRNRALRSNTKTVCDS